jgi:hypothetical protein
MSTDYVPTFFCKRLDNGRTQSALCSGMSETRPFVKDSSFGRCHDTKESLRLTVVVPVRSDGSDNLLIKD